MNRLKTAILSVYDKRGIVDLANYLLNNNFQILSSGGTYKILKESINSDKIRTIESYTKFPEILNGRVKTLHPKIAGGILATTSINDENDLIKHQIHRIDMVVCNLYPFSETIQKEHTHNQAIENIDIGGVTLIRAAFKNYMNVITLTNPDTYHKLIYTGIDNITDEDKLDFAKTAMQHISKYDNCITQYFDDSIEYREYRQISFLKYGCNPHQKKKSSIYQNSNIDFPFTVINGNPGYINYIDAVQSWCLVTELKKILGVPCAASFKHTAPAGVGTYFPIPEIYDNIYGIDSKNIGKVATAFIRARTADPLSSFGDFISISDIVDKETALLIKREVSDGIVALGYSDEALDILKSKKSGNYVILKGDTNLLDNLENNIEYRELNGIVLSQEINTKITDNTFLNNLPTERKFFPDFAKTDLVIANTTLKYTPSNSIVYACEGQVVGVGAGQQNRVDCVKLAGRKARKWVLTVHPKTLEMINNLKPGVKRQEKVNIIIQFLENDFTENEYKNWLGNFVDGYIPNFITKDEENKHMKPLQLSLASDAFFPFRDNIDKCAQNGVKYIIQPGGSVADNGIIEACNEYGIAMCMSGVRVFTH